MARNRKYQSAAIRFGPALKALVLCMMVGGSGVGFVWQKNQIVELVRQTTAREAKLNALEEHNEKLRNLLGKMRSAQELMAQAKAMGLSAPAQILTLPEPARPIIKIASERPKQQDMASR
jgi:hypothetical protein